MLPRSAIGFEMQTRCYYSLGLKVAQQIVPFSLDEFLESFSRNKEKLRWQRFETFRQGLALLAVLHLMRDHKNL